jgi:hypothetical protein
MGLRDRLKSSVRSLMDRFSGEYSAAETEIRPDDPQAPATPGSDVKVTRARLKRPKDAREEIGGG